MSLHRRCRDHLSAGRTWTTEQLSQVFGPLVFFQCSFLFKGFLTLRARMLLLVSRLAVDEVEVTQQVGPVGESLATLCAQVGFLSGVDSLVVHELRIAFESQAALSTLER